MNASAGFAVLVIGFVIWLTQGRVEPASPGRGELALLLLGALCFCFPFVYNKKIYRPASTALFVSLLLLIPIITSLLRDNLLYPDLAQQNQAIQFLGPLRTIPANIYKLFHLFLWCSSLYWVALFLRLQLFKGQCQGGVLLGALLGVVNLILVLVVVPFPLIDVFTSNTTAVVKLLEGENPYTAKYLDLYAGQQGYAPSFGYLPGYFLAGVPALILGDVRYASVVAILVIIIWALSYPGKGPHFLLKKTALIGCILFGGSVFYILEQAWIDPILAASFFLAGLCLKEDRIKTAGFFLGWAASIKQYGFIGVAIFIFFVLSSKGKRNAILVLAFAALTFLTIISPFFIWGPGDFLNCTVSGIRNLPTRIDSLSIRSYFYLKSGVDHAWISWLFPFIMLTLLGWTSRLKIPTVANAFFFSGFAYFTIFLFSPHAFANYYYFVFLLFLCGLAFSEMEGSDRPSGLAQKSGFRAS